MSLSRLQTTTRTKPQARRHLQMLLCGGLALLQLNVQGLTTAKINIIQQMTFNNKVTTGHIGDKHRGVALFVGNVMACSAVEQSTEEAEEELSSTIVQDTTIVNICKPPPSRLAPLSLPDVPSPALYAGMGSILSARCNSDTTRPWLLQHVTTTSGFQ
ncbi:hypothetical protein NHX12_019315 [Muraenolepis orangiensis]|uniref:Uncharacterized protein n=1 Tax=Muraenolepis orangiensis TaxID=630683 RepID=A0A9Q0IVX9_9TELE|nr:hypothetical protein NHX12_019315 [Muraenolepis orangiensis]